jgi:hypothetical protein
MGLTSSQMATFSKNTAYAAVETAKLGIGVEEVIRLQQSMGEGLGKNLILTRDQIKGVAEMAKGTNLGVEGVSAMAEGFSSFGVNLDTMRDRVEGVFQSTQKLGLNSSKVIKTISDNLKTAQKYNFKDGSKSLDEMAKRAVSVKMDLSSVFGLVYISVCVPYIFGGYVIKYEYLSVFVYVSLFGVLFTYILYLMILS